MTAPDRRGAATPAAKSSLLETATRHPQVVIAVAAGLEVALEAAHLRATTDTWILAQTLVFAAALVLVWRGQEALRLRPTVAIVAAFHLALMLVRLRYGMDGDIDARRVYASEGHAFV